MMPSASTPADQKFQDFVRACPSKLQKQLFDNPSIASFEDLWTLAFKPLLEPQERNFQWIAFIRDNGLALLLREALGPERGFFWAYASPEQVVRLCELCFFASQPPEKAQRELVLCLEQILSALQDDASKTVLLRILFKTAILAKHPEIGNKAKAVLQGSFGVFGPDLLAAFVCDSGVESVRIGSSSGQRLSLELMSQLELSDGQTVERVLPYFFLQLTGARFVDLIVPIVRSMLPLQNDIVHICLLQLAGLSLPREAASSFFSSQKALIDLFCVFDSSPDFDNAIAKFVEAHLCSSGAESLAALIGCVKSADTAGAYEQFAAVQEYKQLRKAMVGAFNKNPQKGIDFGLEHDLIADGMASLLLCTPGLSKSSIGHVLAEQLDVLEQYLLLLDFSKASFLGALRRFLLLFKMPGEAQKVDRVLELFAKRYCSSKPDFFLDVDAAHSLAYACIMLNTDLHSPQIKRKMELSEFIRNLRGICANKSDAPASFLEDVYFGIAGEKIELASLHLTWIEVFAVRRIECRARPFSSRGLFELIAGSLVKTLLQECSAAIHLTPSSKPGSSSHDVAFFEARWKTVDRLFLSLVDIPHDTSSSLSAFFDGLKAIVASSPPVLQGIVHRWTVQFAETSFSRVPRAAWESILGLLQPAASSLLIDLSKLSIVSTLCLCEALPTQHATPYLFAVHSLPSRQLERILTESYALKNRGFFSILSRFCSSTSSEGLRCILSLIRRLQEEQMPFILENVLAFQEHIVCLIELALSGDESIGREAVLCFKSLSILFFSRVSANLAGDAFTNCTRILTGLSRIVIEGASVGVCMFASELLFDILEEHRSRFPSTSQWRVIVQRACLPIVDDLWGQLHAKSDILLSRVCVQVATIYAKHYRLHLEPDFDPFLQHLSSILSSDSEHLGKAVINSIQILLPSCVSPQLMSLIEQASDSSLVSFSSTDPSSLKKAAHSLSLHLSLLQMLNTVLILCDDAEFSSLVAAANEDGLKRLFACLHRSYIYAKHFNENTELRTSLWKAGFMSELKDVLLIKQETCSILTLLSSQFRIAIGGFLADCASFLQLALDVSEELLNRYIEFLKDPKMHSVDLFSWSIVVQAIYADLSKLLDSACPSFTSRLPLFCRKALATIPTDDMSVRHAALSFVSNLTERLFEAKREAAVKDV